MAEYPLLPLPAPVRRKVKGSGWGGGQIRLPDRERQTERLGPVFERLRSLRAWGPEDRVPDDAVEFLQRRLKESPDSAHRVGVELWSRATKERREQARRRFREVLGKAGGKLIHAASIADVAYEAALVDARLIGYGRPAIEEALTCTSSRATLIGFGEIAPDGLAEEYRVPLPPSLSAVAKPRCVACTLAWFTPVNVRHRMYRRARLDLQAGQNLREKDGFLKRVKRQPAAASVRRGSLLHVRHEGERAASFVGDGHLHFSVACTTPAGSLDEPIRYGLAVTVEAGEGVPVYAEIREGLEVRQRV